MPRQSRIFNHFPTGASQGKITQGLGKDGLIIPLWTTSGQVFESPHQLQPAPPYGGAFSFACCLTILGSGHNVGKLLGDLCGLLDGRRYGVGVNIGRGADLCMAQSARDHGERSAVGDHQARVGVAQAVNVDVRQLAPLHEGGKPFCQRVGEHRGAVVSGEYAADRVLPIIAAGVALDALSPLLLEENRGGGR